MQKTQKGGTEGSQGEATNFVNEIKIRQEKEAKQLFRCLRYRSRRRGKGMVRERGGW